MKNEFKNALLESLSNNLKIKIENIIPSFGKDFFDKIIKYNEGVNDLFAVYNLVKDPKKAVYLAVKNKVEKSRSSYINIIKIKSVDNFTIIQRLYGHNQRIVIFII